MSSSRRGNADRDADLNTAFPKLWSPYIHRLTIVNLHKIHTNPYKSMSVRYCRVLQSQSPFCGHMCLSVFSMEAPGSTWTFRNQGRQRCWNAACQGHPTTTWKLGLTSRSTRSPNCQMYPNNSKHTFSIFLYVSILFLYV